MTGRSGGGSEPDRETDPIREAAEAALAGMLVVLPTDTVYGIGTRPDDEAAIERLFEAKQRPRDLDLPVLVPSPEAALDIAVFDERSERIARAAWPGALTLVLPRTDASRPWNLGENPETIGVRMPAHPLALAVLSVTGPLAVTSANLSGGPPATTCEELADLFGEAVAVYLCEEGPLMGRPSTVVDLAHGDPVVLRAGALDEVSLASLLGI